MYSTEHWLQEQNEGFYPYPLMISLWMGTAQNDFPYDHYTHATYSLRVNLGNAVIEERHYNKSKLLYTKRSQNHKMHPYQHP